jgi:ubiquinone/menaquinone biosynthesis C-methylase UbiE
VPATQKPMPLIRSPRSLSSASYLRSGPVWGKRDIWQIPSTTWIAVDMLEKLPISGSIIDLGCGTGKGLTALAPLGAESLVGLDVNIGATTYAQAKWSLRKSAAFIAGDATGLPFADNSFDLAVAQAFLTVIPTEKERVTVIDEARRVLHPGGHLYVGDFLQNENSELYRQRYELGEKFSGEYGTFPVEGPDGHIAYFAHHFAADELEELLSDRGFEVLSTQLQPAKTYSGRSIVSISVVARLNA